MDTITHCFYVVKSEKIGCGSIVGVFHNKAEADAYTSNTWDHLPSRSRHSSGFAPLWQHAGLISLPWKE